MGDSKAVENWAQFESAIKNWKEEQRRAQFRSLVRTLIKTNPIYKHRFSLVYEANAVPNELRERHGLNIAEGPGSFDLVCFSNSQEELWLIYTKLCRKGEVTIPLHELTDCLRISFSVVRGVEGILICTSAETVSESFHEHDAIELLLLPFWKDLPPEAFQELAWPRGTKVKRKVNVKYRKFKLARIWARGLGLETPIQWRMFSHSKILGIRVLPADVPENPDIVYVDQGWTSWMDWLGTNRADASLTRYRPFTEAREWVRALELKNAAEWMSYTRGEMAEKEKLPPDIPAHPNLIYSELGWINLLDWLGASIHKDIADEIWEFEPARTWVRSLGLKSHHEWHQWVEGELEDYKPRPEYIPIQPERAYQGRGWSGWRDWLDLDHTTSEHLESLDPDTEPGKQKTVLIKGGTDSTELVEEMIEENFCSFEQARDWVRSLGLANQVEWRRFCNSELLEKGMLSPDIPVFPEHAYRDEGWNGMTDWLGVKHTLPEFRSFENAREFAMSLKLHSHMAWKRYCRGEIQELPPLPPDIPTCPNLIYEGLGWESMTDWLGTNTQITEYRSFSEARKWAQKLGLKNHQEWSEFCQGKIEGKALPEDIPAYPNLIYDDVGWIDYADWLRLEKKPEASEDTTDPEPELPKRKFFWIKGDIGPTQLEEKTVQGNFCSFEKAREWVHALGLSNQIEWRRFCKGELPEKGILSPDIPVFPEHAYREEKWNGMADWLGVKHTLPEYRSFESARDFARTLHLHSHMDWKRYCRGEIHELPPLPPDIPTCPNLIYDGTGWMSMTDWIGTLFKVPEYRGFGKARKWARNLKLKNHQEWFKFCRGEIEGEVLPEDIPMYPNLIYDDVGWHDMGDWLGLVSVPHLDLKYRSFIEAREWVRSLKLKSHVEWIRFCKGELPEKGSLPNDIPLSPDRTYYSLGWIDWGDWLGIEKEPPNPSR